MTENCHVVVNMSLLKSRLDITVDGWSWILSKTYVVSSHTTNDSFNKGNNASHYRVVKRVYKRKTAEDLKKCIITRFVPRKNAPGRYTNIFNESEPHAVISCYFGEGERLIPPNETSRMYPSVRDEIKPNLEKGIAPKRATHNTLKKLGGINAVPSASHVPTITQVYEILRSLKPKNTDLLKKLIEKQQSDGCTEHSVIQKIQTNQFSYNIVLFNKRIIESIANFCCTERKEVKSALCWDFTFDIGKSPPYYLLALSYQNTILFNKTTKRCLVMLGPVLICHKKD